MEPSSGSGDSFAWTDTSSENSESIIMVKDGHDAAAAESSLWLKVKQEQATARRDRREGEPRKRGRSPAPDSGEAEEPKKKIKHEPNSPLRVKSEANGHDAAAAERSLWLKVKQEQAAARRDRREGEPRKRGRSPAPDSGEAEPGGAPGADEDLWLVRAPRGLAGAALAGARLRAAARCTVSAAGRRYEALPEPAPARMAVWFGRLRGAALRGALRLRERLPRAPPPAPLPCDPEFAIPLPVTRVRHPLLGADYERVLEAMNVAREPRKSRTVDPEPELETKKKKRDKSRRSPPPAPLSPGSVWDSERGIEEILFHY